MNHRSILLKRLQQQTAANNAATPVQVAVEETPAASTEVLSPEVVAQIEPQPAPTPVVAEVPKATPVVAKPQPQVQKTEIPSYKKVETGKKKIPKNVDIKDLAKVLNIPVVGMVQQADYVQIDKNYIVSSMTASTQSGRRNVVPMDNTISKEIIEILEQGQVAFVNITAKSDIHVVTQVIGSASIQGLEGKSFSAFNQITQWILNQMQQHNIEMTTDNMKAAMDRLIVVNTGTGFVVLNKTTVTNAVSAATIAPAAISATPAVTAVSATNVATAIATEGAGVTATAATTEGVATNGVATTAATTGK